jgi:hypothetical protein
MSPTALTKDIEAPPGRHDLTMSLTDRGPVRNVVRTALLQQGQLRPGRSNADIRNSPA